MLVLKRKVQERIKIGPDIWVMVTKVEGQSAYLGIEAPKEIRIFREELIEREPCQPN